MIDKIEMIGGNKRRVVDYKTGKIDAKSIAKRSAKHNGGEYWNQLLFYKLLYEQRFPQSNIQTGFIDYVTLENGNKSVKPIEFTDDDTTWMRNRIQITYEQILNLDFYKGCAKKDCQWCSFVQNSVTPSNFDNKISEGLDDGLGMIKK
jgi:DNA helicase-2/ATP-dependent DNA helicase PcrA